MGSDIVVWIAIRHHYEPRFKAEEAVFLPYHHEEFHITPVSSKSSAAASSQGIRG